MCATLEGPSNRKLSSVARNRHRGLFDIPTYIVGPAGGFVSPLLPQSAGDSKIGHYVAMGWLDFCILAPFRPHLRE